MRTTVPARERTLLVVVPLLVFAVVALVGVIVVWDGDDDPPPPTANASARVVAVALAGLDPALGATASADGGAVVVQGAVTAPAARSDVLELVADLGVDQIEDRLVVDEQAADRPLSPAVRFADVEVTGAGEKIGVSGVLPDRSTERVLVVALEGSTGVPVRSTVDVDASLSRAVDPPAVRAVQRDPSLEPEVLAHVAEALLGAWPEGRLVVSARSADGASRLASLIDELGVEPARIVTVEPGHWPPAGDAAYTVLLVGDEPDAADR